MASIGQELLNVPMGDMIRQMAFAIAEAQVRLDESSISVAEMMGGLRVVRDDATGDVAFDDSRVFFGHEYMTVADARAYLAVDNAISGNEGEIDAALKRIVDAQKPVDGDEDDDDDDDDKRQIRVPVRISMLELGFTPTFYQFVDTVIELKMSISMNSSVETSQSSTRISAKASLGFFSAKANVSCVSASFASKYQYSAEGSSIMRTKLVPIPPPAILEERIRKMIEAKQPA